MLLHPLSTTASSSTTNEWRRHQLDKLEKRHADKRDDSNHNNKHEILDNNVQVLNIADEEDLQPMWKQMERRVVNRRSYRLGEGPLKGRAVKVGRTNVRETEEDVWLKQGLYDGIPSNGSE